MEISYLKKSTTTLYLLNSVDQNVRIYFSFRPLFQGFALAVYKCVGPIQILLKKTIKPSFSSSETKISRISHKYFVQNKITYLNTFYL